MFPILLEYSYHQTGRHHQPPLCTAVRSAATGSQTNLGRYRESYGSSQAGTMVPKIQYSYVPICSMVLVYLPTKLGHLWGTCWLLFSSTMNHLGYSLRLWMFIPEDVVFSMVLIHPHCGVPRILSMVETRNSAKMGRPYRTKPVTYWMIYWLLPTKIRYYGR